MGRWMVSADELSDEQTQFVFENSRKKENLWIKGHAGSGKSVLLIHTLLDKVNSHKGNTICIVLFTHALIELFKAGMQEIGLNTNNITIMTYIQFRRNNSNYDYIFCDEVQDLTKSILEKMKGRAGQLIVAGDSNQSIYPDDPSTRESTLIPSEIDAIIGNNSFTLDAIFRLNKSIVTAIGKFLPNIGIFSAKLDRTKIDSTIRIGHSNSSENEVEYVLNNAKDAVMIDENIVILLPTHHDIIEFVNIALTLNNKQQWKVIENNWGKPNLGFMNKHLLSNDMNIEYLGNGEGNLYGSTALGKIIIMTYHSSKGLDFDNVFLPFMNIRDDWFDRNVLTPTVFMVGMSRSKNALYLTYSENMHNYVKSFEDGCTKIDIDNLQNDSDDDLDFDF